MTEIDQKLPDSVTRIDLDGREVYLVGTAHVSKESVVDVQDTVAAIGPDTICVELCYGRHNAIIQRDSWQKMNIFKVVKEGKSLFLLAQLIMTSFYKRIGDQVGVQPGAEMIEGIKLAEKTGAELVLADREIEITLKRVWGYLNLWNKMKMMTHLIGSIFIPEKIDEELIEEIKEQDQLEAVMEDFSKSFPEVKRRLIDERDIYLAQKIRQSKGKKVVAIVGAGHVPGMQEHIDKDIDLEPLRQLPPKSIAPTIIKWAIPTLIIAMMIFGFYKGGGQHSMESIYIWVLANAILAAAGAAIAFAHPLTIAASFFAAPITSLNPMIAAGWVSGLVQAGVKKPTVADLEDLPNAISSVKGFWTNPVSRILLVVVMANLGSSLGTFIAGSWIAMRTF